VHRGQEEPVEVPVEKIVYRDRAVPVEKVVVSATVRKEQHPVEKVVERAVVREVAKEVPVERLIVREREVPRNGRPDTHISSDQTTFQCRVSDRHSKGKATKVVIQVRRSPRRANPLLRESIRRPLVSLRCRYDLTRLLARCGPPCVPQEKAVRVPVDKIIIRERPFPVEKVVQKIHVKQVFVERIVEITKMEIVREVPVDVPVERVVFEDREVTAERIKVKEKVVFQVRPESQTPNLRRRRRLCFSPQSYVPMPTRRQLPHAVH
jgi:hypothetical protein